jgi:hypothetical protein
MVHMPLYLTSNLGFAVALGGGRPSTLSPAGGLGGRALEGDEVSPGEDADDIVASLYPDVICKGSRLLTPKELESHAYACTTAGGQYAETIGQPILWFLISKQTPHSYCFPPPPPCAIGAIYSSSFLFSHTFNI